MSECQQLEPLFACYVDDDAGMPKRAAVAAHLEACPPCRERVAAERAAREVVLAHRSGLRCRASDRLRARCAAAQSTATDAAPRKRIIPRRAWVPLSLAATLVLAVAGVFLFGLTEGVEALAAQLAVDHIKCFEFPPARSTPDAAAMGRDWAGSHGWALTVPPSVPAKRLELLGVRRCMSTEGKVAHLMYRWRGQPLSIFVLPKARLRDRADTDAFRKLGQETILWSSHGRTYAVVARGQPSDLNDVAGYLKQAVQ